MIEYKFFRDPLVEKWRYFGLLDGTSNESMLARILEVSTTYIIDFIIEDEPLDEMCKYDVIYPIIIKIFNEHRSDWIYSDNEIRELVDDVFKLIKENLLPLRDICSNLDIEEEFVYIIVEKYLKYQ